MYYHDTVALNVKCIILYLYKKIKKFKTHRYSQSTKKKKIVKFNTFGLEETTLCRLYFATAEVRFMFSSSFRKLGLAFNLEYLCQFFINFNNQCQFWNPHDEQITNLSLIFKINEEITEKIGNEKDEDEINF